MNLSWKIGSLFGIPIRLHYSMLLVPLLTYGRFPMGGFWEILIWLALVFMLFGSVLLHELGHALTARRYGVRTQDIILTPLGGMARVVDLPQLPRQEIAIAIAGPLVSLALAGISYGIVLYLGWLTPVTLLGLSLLYQINLMLGLFNLVPALPMDGGRVLRGYLAMKRDFLTATKIAAKVGRIIAVAGGLYAVFVLGEFILALIAVFIYTAAGQEVRMAQMREFQRKMGENGHRQSTGNPFGGYPGGARVWQMRWPGGAGGGARPSEPQETHEDWTRPKTESSDKEVIYVEGGKVKIISRRDPNEK